MPADPFAPPRPELIALLDAVKDHPDEDTPRLVLADWLDEQDNELDAERAKIIRDHVAAARTHAPIPWHAPESRTPLLQRWLGPVMRLAQSGAFDRGLPWLAITGPRFLKPDVPALLATEAFAFVQYVHLAEAGGPRMEKMAATPEFRHVAGLVVSPFSPLGTHYATKFFGSPNLIGLRWIGCRSVNPGVAGVQALAGNPALAGLRKLTLAHNKLVDQAAVALAGSPHLANLQNLFLADNNIGDKGAEALTASKTLANLRELDLTLNPRLTEVGKRRLRDRFGDRVRLD